MNCPKIYTVNKKDLCLLYEYILKYGKPSRFYRSWVIGDGFNFEIMAEIAINENKYLTYRRMKPFIKQTIAPYAYVDNNIYGFASDFREYIDKARRYQKTIKVIRQ